MKDDYQNFVERMGSFEDTIDLTDNEVVNKTLKHFGIPGMHWGHHKAINATTIGATARTGQTISTLGQTINKSGYSTKALKEAKTMTDEDLKKLTNRMNLENNYMNAKNVQSGKDKIDNILAIAGSTLAVASSAAILYDTVKKFT